MASGKPHTQGVGNAARKIKAAKTPHVSVVRDAEKPKGFRRMGRKLIPLSEKQKAIVAAHAWKKGQPSANPDGRPKGIVERIREATGDGQVLIDGLIKITESPMARTSDKISAAQILLERGYGKAPQQIVVTPTTPVDNVDLNLPPDQLDALRNGLRLIDVPPSDTPEAPEDTGK